jgi:hypothetical protein
VQLPRKRHQLCAAFALCAGLPALTLAALAPHAVTGDLELGNRV